MPDAAGIVRPCSLVRISFSIGTAPSGRIGLGVALIGPLWPPGRCKADGAEITTSFDFLLDLASCFACNCTQLVNVSDAIAYKRVSLRMSMSAHQCLLLELEFAGLARHQARNGRWIEIQHGLERVDHRATVPLVSLTEPLAELGPHEWNKVESHIDRAEQRRVTVAQMSIARDDVVERRIRACDADAHQHLPIEHERTERARARQSQERASTKASGSRTWQSQKA